MASHPPSDCCTVGVKHEGEPTGTTFKLADNIETYVAEPKGTKKDAAILFITDVLGVWQNSQLMADQFAANGYYTLLPDLFDGDAIPLNGSLAVGLMEWLKNGSDGKHPHTSAFVDPIVEKALKYLKEEKGFKKVGAVGYCFGGKYVARFLAEGKGIDVGYTAHPSFVTDEELAAITGPFSISAAETDTIFTTELRHKSETILIGTKQPFQINLFSGVSHGFAMRGDLSVKAEKFGREQAFLQAVAWFNEYLS